MEEQPLAGSWLGEAASEALPPFVVAGKSEGGEDQLHEAKVEAEGPSGAAAVEALLPPPRAFTSDQLKALL